MQTKKKGVLSRLANLVPVLREFRREMKNNFAAQRMIKLPRLLDFELRNDPRFQDLRPFLKFAFRVNSHGA